MYFNEINDAHMVRGSLLFDLEHEFIYLFIYFVLFFYTRSEFGRSDVNIMKHVEIAL